VLLVTLAAAAAAALAFMVVAVLMVMTALVVMVVMMAAITVAVVVLVTFGMQMVMLVGMTMLMGVGVIVLVGVGHTVVGVLVGVGVLMLVAVATDVIMVQMHKKSPFHFSFIITAGGGLVKTFILSPVGACEMGRKMYNIMYHQEGGREMSDHIHDHHHDHAYQHAHGIAHSHGHVHENQKAVVNRLARAIGHLEKVKRMVEEGYDCSEVLVQLAAVRSALDNTGKVILQDHLRHCMVDAVAAGDENAIDELCQAIDKFMK
jgi:DNA-binding FrmR family transcriptional regulator